MRISEFWNSIYDEWGGSNFYRTCGIELSPDGDELRAAAEGDMRALAEAKKIMDRERIALNLAAAIKSGHRFALYVDAVPAWETLAELYLEVEDYDDLRIKTMLKTDCWAAAVEIYEQLFAKCKTQKYFKLLVDIKAENEDKTDYSDLTNYINRPIGVLKKGVISLGKYDVLENDDEEIMIAMDVTPMGDHDKPVLFCDGSEHAILFKGPYCAVVCDFLHPEIRKKICRAKEVLFYETPTSREYMAPVVVYMGTSQIAEKLLAIIEKQS